ncbi:EAL domain-containing protein, partial [bacterium]|nr:EAL domain-containing protein [bacterium]
FLNDLLEYLRKNSFIIDENEIYLHFSTGAYSGEKNHLVNADIALQQARVMNKDICSYDDLPDIKAVQQNNLNWIKKLHHAIEEDRIKAFYQPIVNNKDGKIEKYEALVRMMDEGGKPISPFFFLDVAKKTKLYEKLTRTVFDQTMKLAAEVEKSFSINLTVTDFKNIKLMDYIYETLIASKVAKRIVFEIVESEELESKDLLDAITRLKECGSKISIDDFGTGYSNFNYLVKMNADIIKIDGSIIKYILEDKNSELMVKTIVSLANQLGAKTIAEFVESEAIFQKVKELGVDYSQGYFFSMPLESI